MSDAETLTRAARQQLETCLLLGVDFLPRRRPVVAPASPSPAAAPRARSASESAPITIPAVRLVSGDRAAMLDALRARHDAKCAHCTSRTGYTNMVFGEGDPYAAIMFIGEAPGEEEDRTGRPFVGRAGQKLDEIVRAMGLTREQVYIANVLKTRPPNNRTPQPDEAAACGPYLAEQIGIIRPKVIVAMGGPASKYLLDTREGITRIRGSWWTYRTLDDVEIPVMPTFHPAYLLRNYTMETRQMVWSDMQEVMKTVGLTG